MKNPIRIALKGIPNDLPAPDSPPEGITVVDYERRMSLDGDGLQVLILVVGLAASVPLSLLAQWLYEKKKSNSPMEVSIDEETQVTYKSHDLEVFITAKFSITERKASTSRRRVRDEAKKHR